MASNDGKRDRVVIVGGGFAGLNAARRLKHAPVELTLIDKRNFHLFQPLLYQVATGGLSPGDIASPLRAVLRKQKNTRVVLDEVTDIDAQRQCVIGTQAEYGYDWVILATGVEYRYFGNDSWQEHAPALKTIEQALEIRRRVLLAFEQAELESDPDVRAACLTFVVIGGGPTGVELAGAIGELAQTSLRANFRTIDPAQARVLLLEGSDSILSPYPTGLQTRARTALASLGVEVRTGHMVREITNTHVQAVVNGDPQTIATRTAIWAAGVGATGLNHQLAKSLKLETDHMGRIAVNRKLQAPNHPNIFVIGDMAHALDASGEPLPGVAPVAMQQGRYVGTAIKKASNDKAPADFRYVDKGSLAVIGRNAAVAHFGRIKLWGFPAWLIWVVVHIAYLIGFDNKLLVMIQWAWNYITRKRGARLISTTSESNKSTAFERAVR